MSLTMQNQIEDALADLEAHVHAIGKTVVERIAEGETPHNAVKYVAEMTEESFDFVKTSTMSVLEEEIDVY